MPLLCPKAHASLQNAVVPASKNCVQWLPEGPSPAACVLERGCSFPSSGVSVHTGGGGIPWWEARGKGCQPRGGLQRAPLGSLLGPPAVGWAEPPGWQLAAGKTRLCSFEAPNSKQGCLSNWGASRVLPGEGGSLRMALDFRHRPHLPGAAWAGSPSLSVRDPGWSPAAASSGRQLSSC